MKIEDLHRTRIEVTVPEGHRSWMQLPNGAIQVDGHPLNPTAVVGVHHQLDDAGHTITFCESRVLYPTELWVNGVLRAVDNGLLWDKRPLRLAGQKED